MLAPSAAANTATSSTAVLPSPVGTSMSAGQPCSSTRCSSACCHGNGVQPWTSSKNAGKCSSAGWSPAPWYPASPRHLHGMRTLPHPRALLFLRHCPAAWRRGAGARAGTGRDRGSASSRPAPARSRVRKADPGVHKPAVRSAGGRVPGRGAKPRPLSAAPRTPRPRWPGIASDDQGPRDLAGLVPSPAEMAIQHQRSGRHPLTGPAAGTGRPPGGLQAVPIRAVLQRQRSSPRHAQLESGSMMTARSSSVRSAGGRSRGMARATPRRWPSA